MSFIVVKMAHEDKPLELRPVDENDAERVRVIRLENSETGWKDMDEKPIRLGVIGGDSDTSQHLDLPTKEAVELRTHQPGIDVLIEAETMRLSPLEETWGEFLARRNPIPWGWFALIGLIIISAVIWSLNRVKTGEEHVDQASVKLHEAVEDDEKEEREAGRLIDMIDKSIRSFFNATSVAALVPMVRHPERVAPLMREYYRENPWVAGRLKAIKTLHPLTLGNRGNFWMVSVSLSDGKTQSLMVEVLDAGEPRMDWETLVCYQPMKWDDFVARRPTGTSLDFRVMIKRDHLYSHEFSNPERWVCFLLTAMGSEEMLFGYAPVGSEVAQNLLALIQQSANGQSSVILRLGIPKDLKSRRGVIIEKLVSSRWLYLDPPDTDS